MRTLRRGAAVLICSAIAYLGTACESTKTPTEARGPTKAFDLSSDPTRWVNSLALTHSPPGTSCANSGYATIQEAINDAIAGEIIMVCAGPYPEPAPGPLTINKTLTLLGAQAGVDARGRVATEAIVTDPQGTIITANNVMVDGFTFANSSVAAFTGFGIAMGAGTSGTQILNNIIQNNIAGVALSNAPGGSQAVIRHNQIQNNNAPGGASGTGIYTDQFVSGGAVSNVLIQENSFLGNNDAGIDVSNTDAANGVSGLEVSHNSFNLNGRAFVLFNTHTSSIHDNSITNSTFVGSAAIRLFNNNSNLSFTFNDLMTGAGHAIRFSVLSPMELGGAVLGPSSNVVINENNIGTMGSASFIGDGLLVDPGSTTATVDATCNWWGSSTGPTSTSNPGGTGEEVVGDANFTPWLLAPAPGGLCAGGVPSGKVTGGGQVPVTGGQASFGFNAKSSAGVGSGHLNYLNHVTGAHLDCTVTFVTQLTSTMAKFQGTCSANSAANSFMAQVEDHGNPGKGNDKFTITYGAITDGGTLTSGNIQIHQ